MSDEDRIAKLEAVLREWVEYESDTSQCPDCSGCIEDDDGSTCIYRTAVAVLAEGSDEED